MSVEVLIDGQMVDRVYGDGAIGPTDRRVNIGYSKVEVAGTVLRDDEVSEAVLDLTKAGEIPGLRWRDDDAESVEDKDVSSADVDALLKENDNLNSQAADLDQKLSELTAELADKDEQIATLTADLQAAQTANAQPGEMTVQQQGQDAVVGAAPAAGGSQEQGGSGAESFDPSQHVQGDVLEYLKTADAGEVARVQAAEASGQNRQGIAGFKPAGAFE